MKEDNVELKIPLLNMPMLTCLCVCVCWRENEVEEQKEEGPKEMTLDEWKAMQDKERAKVEFNIRKANEGADWNKGFVLHKSKAEVRRFPKLLKPHLTF